MAYAHGQRRGKISLNNFKVSAASGRGHGGNGAKPGSVADGIQNNFLLVHKIISD
jgi:hypothetical protein